MIRLPQGQPVTFRNNFLGGHIFLMTPLSGRMAAPLPRSLSVPPKVLSLAVCTVFCVAQGALAQASVGAWLADPLDTESGMSASPAQAWTAPHRLPRVPKPQTLPAAEQGQVWTLPQLTAYALAHNPQTAAAWDGLRAQAAGLGMAGS